MKCIICNKEAGKFGNNSLPIIEGRCCDDCNMRLVVPMRIRINYLCEQISKDVEEAVTMNRKTKTLNDVEMGVK